VQHIFGGSVGGPIIKNKLLFFTNLQLLRAYDTALVTRTVYTPRRAGLFRYVVGRAMLRGHYYCSRKLERRHAAARMYRNAADKRPAFRATTSLRIPRA
jgi:hypothetical protein